MDHPLVNPASELYVAGVQHHHSARLLAAILNKWAVSGKMGWRTIHRNDTALKDCKLLTPARCRKARPLVVWLAKSKEIASKGRWLIEHPFFALSTCLRQSGEEIWLHPRSLSCMTRVLSWRHATWVETLAPASTVSLYEVQQRCVWMCQTSVNWFEKSSRMASDHQSRRPSLDVRLRDDAQSVAPPFPVRCSLRQRRGLAVLSNIYDTTAQQHRKG